MKFCWKVGQSLQTGGIYKVVKILMWLTVPEILSALQLLEDSIIP